MKIKANVKAWLEFVGENEEVVNYSQVLLGIQSLQYFAKASNYTKGIKKLFKNIILGTDKNVFYHLCQDKDEKLLHMIIETGKEKKRKRKVVHIILNCSIWHKSVM